MEPLVRLRDVRRSFVLHGQTIEVLRGADLDVAPAERVAITGPSGAGKSTLLAIIGLIDERFEGAYAFQGRNVRSANAAEWSAWRLADLGFAFQDLHLVPALTALENVALPMMALGRHEGVARERAATLLAAAGLAPRGGHRPAFLSGGERRRTAFARALANRPKLLLVDEPTGDLDATSTEGVVRLLDHASQEGSAVIVVTHDPRLLAWCPRRLELREGRLESMTTPVGAGPATN